MLKPFLLKNSKFIHPIAVGDKRVHTFSKDISLKLNVIVRLEFELAYHDVTVFDVSYKITNVYLKL